MQLKLSQIMIMLTAICVILGLTFASPPVLGVPLLGLILVALPAIFVTGITWSQGKTRAGFVGAGVSAGGPWFAIAAYLFPDILFRGGWTSNSFWMPAMASDWWMSNLFLLFPLVCALIGWVAARLTFRFVSQPADSAKVTNP